MTFDHMLKTGVGPTGAYWCTDCAKQPRAGGSIRCLDCERLYVARIEEACK